MMYTVSQNNIHIIASWRISKKEFDAKLDNIAALYPDCEVLIRRKRWHLKFEWATHNALYDLGIARERTADIDLNYPLKWYAKIGYAIAGFFVWIFID